MIFKLLSNTFFLSTIVWSNFKYYNFQPGKPGSCLPKLSRIWNQGIKRSVINGGEELRRRINFKTTVLRGSTTEWSAFWHSLNLRSGPTCTIVEESQQLSWEAESSAGAQSSSQDGHSRRTATKNLMSNKYKTQTWPDSNGCYRLWVRVRYRPITNVLLRRVVLLSKPETRQPNQNSWSFLVNPAQRLKLFSVKKALKVFFKVHFRPLKAY